MDDDDEKAVAQIESAYTDGWHAGTRGPIRMHWDSVILQLAGLRELRKIRELLETALGPRGAEQRDAPAIAAEPAGPGATTRVMEP